MVSLGLRWGSICQQTPLARKILWHRGWVRSLPSTEHYEGACNEAMKPAHASAFVCLLLWRIIPMSRPSSCLVLFRSTSSTQLHFLSSADLAGKLGTSIEKSFLSLSPLTQHHPHVWLWNSLLNSFCPLIVTCCLYQPLMFRLHTAPWGWISLAGAWEAANSSNEEDGWRIPARFCPMNTLFYSN